MTTNPGGVVDPDDLVGRETEVAELLRLVSMGGARTLGDRRIGKTSVLGATAAALNATGHIVVRVSAETSDPRVFERHVADELRRDRRMANAVARWEKQFGGEIGVNVGLASFKLTFGAKPGAPAREFDLFELCSVAARRAGPYRLVFMFDEITTLAGALAGGDRSASADLFHALRVPRQQLDNVSIVLAGSIGLHHVLSDFAVVNDIHPVEIGPLRHDDAVYLARCLLRGADVGQHDEAGIAEILVAQCAAIPFYMHKLVDNLDAVGLRAPSANDVDRIVTAVMEDPADEWELRHYVTRLATYFGDDAGLVRHIVDCYALATDGLTLDELSRQLDAVDLSVRPDRDTLNDLIYRLEADHYLIRSGATDRMATDLLRRAWRSIRRLG